jgi:DNA-binding response OmpR family regulator
MLPNFCTKSFILADLYILTRSSVACWGVYQTMTVEIASVANRQFIGAGEIPARLVSIGKRDAKRRHAWLSDVFEAVDIQEYGSTIAANSVLFDANSEFLILGGHDGRRMSALYKEFEPLLRNRVVVAIVTGSTPQTRAAMLRAGFDEVLDIGKVHPLEGIARFRAIWRQRCVRTSAEREQYQRADMLNKVCDASVLTGRERRLIECLLDRPGWCVSFQRLQRIAGIDEDPISVMNLRVSMSKLRRKLVVGSRIEALPNEGYVLVTE